MTDETPASDRGAADRRSVSRSASIVACALAIAATIDIRLSHLAPSILWAALLLAAAMCLAAVFRRHRAGPASPVALHAGGGLLLLAILAISTVAQEAPGVTPAGHHGSAALPMDLVVMSAALLAAAYAIGSVLIVPRVVGRIERIVIVTMAITVLLNAGGLVPGAV